MSLHRVDLQTQFPGYDYNNPREPWRIDFRQHNSLTAAQIQAFHYFWATQQCARSAMIGLSFTTPNLPYSFCVSPNRTQGVHLFAQPDNVDILLEKRTFPLIVASGVISELLCDKVKSDATIAQRREARCKGEEVAKILNKWANLLMPQGILIAVLIDHKYAFPQGWSLFDKSENITHIWTAAQFMEYVLQPCENIFTVKEFDTLKNNYAFNVVLEKK